jgi:hypothetical protein
MTMKDRRIAAALAAFALLVLVLGIGYVRRVGILGDKVSRQIRADLKARDLPDDAPWRDRRTLVLPARVSTSSAACAPRGPRARDRTAGRRSLPTCSSAPTRKASIPGLLDGPLRARLEKQQKTSLEKMSPKALAEFDLLCSIAALHLHERRPRRPHLAAGARRDLGRHAPQERHGRAPGRGAEEHTR